MRPALPLAALALLALLAAPALAGVEVEADPEADFSKYGTYELREGANAPYSPELRAFLLKQINGHLAQAGLKRVEEKGDLVVEVRVFNSFSGGLTGAYISSVTWNVGFLDARIGHVTDGTLIVGIVDPAAQRGLWQGIATKTFGTTSDFGALRKKIEKITDKMFQDFPQQRR